jgi:hypothetical protein
MIKCRLGTVRQQKFSITEVFTDHVKTGHWGYEGPKTVANFVGRNDKLSRVAKRRGFKGKQKHCGPSGVVGLQDGSDGMQIGLQVS